MPDARQVGKSTLAAEVARDRDGLLVTLDDDDVRLRVEAASGASAHDARWLTMLRDRLGDRFVQGVVLHTGSSAGALGERILSAPIDLLWNA